MKYGKRGSHTQDTSRMELTKVKQEEDADTRKIVKE